MLDINFHITFKSKKRTSEISFNTKVVTNAISALYGPSGIGKTTILNIISGLIKPDVGLIQFDDDLWYESEQKMNLKPSERNIAYVFQEYDLFPNMTIQQNLKFANTKKEIPKFVEELIEQVNMNELLESFPSDLSGGQKQRFALMRSLCQQPKLLLLDEPFSASDDQMIIQLISALKKIQQEQQMTIIVATHRKDVIDQFADHIIEL